MEFLLYLSPQGQQLIRDLISAKFHIHENIGFCYNSQMFGYADYPNKFVICTNNIRNGGWDMKRYIPETVYHEAVHVAQICNKGDLGLTAKQTPLPWNKLQDVKNSVKTTKNYGAEHKEREAYYLEDKPQKVRYYVRKFCF